MKDVEAGAARFDPVLRAWILSSYADVRAALRDPRLSAGTASADAASSEPESPSISLFSERLEAWREPMTASARQIAGALPAGQPIDLVQAFARPWSWQLAGRVTGAAPAERARLDRLAHEIFMAAATATDPRRGSNTLDATSQLARALPTADPAFAVQAFVALTQTLPCLLAGVWHELVQQVDLAQRIRDQPGLAPRAIEELLRVTSVGRAVFRRAVTDIQTETVRISAGQRVILMLAAANRDPKRFPDPAAVDLSRRSTPHLAFGQGTHSCVGASIVRMAAAITTSALLETASDVEPVGPVEWVGGFAIRAPATLPVRLIRDPHRC